MKFWLFIYSTSPFKNLPLLGPSAILQYFAGGVKRFGSGLDEKKVNDF
jgi:hypothetical protein